MKDNRPRRLKNRLKFKRRQKLFEFRKRRFYQKQKKRHQMTFIKTLVTTTSNVIKQSIVRKRDNENIVYNDAQMVNIVGFKELYPEVKNTPTLNDLLENIPRQQLVKLAQTLANIYKEVGVNSFQRFFSSTNNLLRTDFNRRFDSIFKKNTSYIFCTIQTITELLKQGFAISHKPKNLSNNDFEENILKAILIINDKLTNFKRETINEDPLVDMAELLLVNSFSQKDINNFDYNTTFRETFTKSIDLFEYIATNEYFKPIYEKFKEELQITDYTVYVKTILGLFIITYQNAQQTKKNSNIEQWAGKFIYDPAKIEDNLISTTVLDYLSISWDANIPLEENDDYKIFRDKPLIKFPDGSYEIVNVGFLLERMFSSLYFDFKTIAKEIKIPNFENEYKENFGEKYLLCKYIEIANKAQQYYAVGSQQSKTMSKNGGEPDFYLKSKNGTSILFEHKDIMINGAVKQSRDLAKIVFEYKNKLLLKTHNNGEVLKNPKPEGIGQLVEQIKKIQTGNAFWDKDVSKDNVVYPVLVIADSKLLPDGLTFLMQKWYEESCESQKVVKEKVKPLIVISISTLLLYAQEFQRKGFEYYFEKYYKSIETAKRKQQGKPLVNIINATVSFSEYMSKTHSKNFIETFNSYRKRIFK